MSWDDHDLVDAFVLQAGLIGERLGRAVADMHVALGTADGITRARLECAVRNIDDSIREIRLLAAIQSRLGEGRTGGRPG